MRSLEVTGPLGTRVVCQYGIITETKTAVIEMASAAGITFASSYTCSIPALIASPASIEDKLPLV